MLSFFSLPKPFVGHIGIIQRNAIRSWRAYFPSAQIILCGNESGTGEIADEVGALWLQEKCHTTQYGAPRLDWIFRHAKENSKYDILCYVNADIILQANFESILPLLPKTSFLLTGRRINLSLKEELKPSLFMPTVPIKDQIQIPLQLDGVRALDYFFFRKGSFDPIPPFALGRCFWDNWLLFAARSQAMPLIDATKVVTALHQLHDYGHVVGGKRSIWTGADRDENLKLAGGGSHIYSLVDADWVLNENGIRPKRRNIVGWLREGIVRAGLSRFFGAPVSEIFNTYMKLKVGVGKMTASLRYE